MVESLEGEEEVEASESEAHKPSLLRYQQAAEPLAREVELMVSSNHSLMHGARPNLSGIMDLEMQNVMEVRKKTSRQSQIRVNFDNIKLKCRSEIVLSLCFVSKPSYFN